MESPGEYLKREREHRGMTLSAVHEATRIPMKHLIAIEADDIDGQPHATFTKGFIKLYCKQLGIDENDAVLRYEMFIREQAEKVDNFRAYADKEGKKWQFPFDIKYLYAAAAVAAVIIAVFYFALIRKGPKIPLQTASVAAQAKDTAAVQPLLQPQPLIQPQTQPQAQVTAQLSGQVKAAEAMKPVAAKAEAMKPVAAKVENPLVKDTSRAALKVAVTPAVNDAEKAAAKNADDTDGKVKKHSVSISASEPVWMKMGIDERPAFNVILKSGESASWRAEKGFRIVVGNAGGASITFDGRKLAPLGPSGKVVNVNLSQGLVDVKLIAPPVR